jgi:hypothetical protein
VIAVDVSEEELSLNHQVAETSYHETLVRACRARGFRVSSTALG